MKRPTRPPQTEPPPPQPPGTERGNNLGLRVLGGCEDKKGLYSQPERLRLSVRKTPSNGKGGRHRNGF